MVINHRRLAGSPKDKLNFGLQFSLLHLSCLMVFILKQVRLSQSQRFDTLLDIFYPGKDDFSSWDRISEFQKSNGRKIQSDSYAVNVLYLGRQWMRSFTAYLIIVILRACFKEYFWLEAF